MGGGSFDRDVYSRASAHRTTTGRPDFEYTARADERTPVHPNLDPRRIRNKPFHKLESRDSDEHPESNAIVLCIDVTGSNYSRAIEAQKKLPNLMALVTRYLPHPQIAVAANDDYNVHSIQEKALQFSDFESDNRIDEHIRNLLLTGKGGGNTGESYDLVMYAAAHYTVLDCFEKRGRKGYFFMYADEPIFTTTSPEHHQGVFEIPIQRSVPIEETIARLKEMYHVTVMWPAGSSYPEAHAQYIRLFGRECVVELQHPDVICEVVAGRIGLQEGRFNTAATITADLVDVGTPADAAASLASSLWGTRPITLRGDSASA